MGAVDCYAGAVEEVITVKGVYFEGFEHPAEDFGVAGLALVVDPRGFVCLLRC